MGIEAKAFEPRRMHSQSIPRKRRYYARDFRLTVWRRRKDIGRTDSETNFHVDAHASMFRAVAPRRSSRRNAKERAPR